MQLKDSHRTYMRMSGRREKKWWYAHSIAAVTVCRIAWSIRKQLFEILSHSLPPSLRSSTYLRMMISCPDRENVNNALVAFSRV